MVAIRATTGRFSLSTTALALMDLNVSGASCIAKTSRLAGRLSVLLGHLRRSVKRWGTRASPHTLDRFRHVTRKIGSVPMQLTQSSEQRLRVTNSVVLDARKDRVLSWPA